MTHGARRRTILCSGPLDGVDVYVGPKPPAGKEGSWIQTVPGKSWNVILWLYGPLEPWFEKAWRPGDVEVVE